MENLVTKLSQRLLHLRQAIAVAESCTGGYLAKVLTDQAGSSQWFEAGVVSYSNAAKQHFLGVSEAMLAEHGAVSLQTAEAMAQGMLKQTSADITVAITGIAGPTGGTLEKPVGMLCFAIASRLYPTLVIEQRFSGDRAQVRQQATIYALEHLLKYLDNE